MFFFISAFDKIKHTKCPRIIRSAQKKTNFRQKRFTESKIKKSTFFLIKFCREILNFFYIKFRFLHLKTDKVLENERIGTKKNCSASTKKRHGEKV